MNQFFYYLFICIFICMLICLFIHSLFISTSLNPGRLVMDLSSLLVQPSRSNLSQTTYPLSGYLSILFPPLIVRFSEWWGEWMNNNVLKEREKEKIRICDWLSAWLSNANNNKFREYLPRKIKGVGHLSEFLHGKPLRLHGGQSREICQS